MYSIFQVHFSHLRYTYLTQLVSVQKSKREASLEWQRKDQERMFSPSKGNWARKPQDVRLRAARLLGIGGRPGEEGGVLG